MGSKLLKVADKLNLGGGKKKTDLPDAPHKPHGLDGPDNPKAKPEFDQEDKEARDWFTMLALAKGITEGHDALDDVTVTGLLAQLNGTLALRSHAVSSYKAEPMGGGVYQIVQFAKPKSSKVGKFDGKKEENENSKKSALNATQRFTSYDSARNAAIKWLEERGFKAEKQNLAKMRLDPNVNKPIGMTDASGKIGFRIEFGLVDGTMAPHINVFDMTQPKGLQDGPHFVFPGTQETVNTIIKRF